LTSGQHWSTRGFREWFYTS